jgi:hypothetical protein
VRRQQTSLRSRHAFPLRLDRRANRLIHLVVSRATAQIAAECIADFSISGVWILCHQRLHSHDEAGSAEAALRSAPIPVGLLNRGQTSVLADALDCRDFLAFATGGEQSARHHRDAVDQNGARATGRIIAAALRARKIEFLPQNVQQNGTRLDRHFVSPSINAEFDEFFFHESFQFLAADF